MTCCTRINPHPHPIFSSVNPKGHPNVVTKELILEALRGVIEPDLKQDIVSLDMVRNLTIRDGEVSLDIALTTPAHPQKAQIRENCENAVRDLQGVNRVDVNLTATVTHGPPPSDRPPLPGVKNIVAVASGKGGVGKSTVAANLAVALGQSGAAVGLMDSDIYGPNIPIMMGIKQRPDAEEDKIIPLEAHGVKLMSMGFISGDNVPVIWRGPMVTKMIEKFLHNVSWGDLDYLILDLPPGTGDVQITIRQSVDVIGAVIVTTPQNLALEDVKRGILMFQQVEVPILGLIENMSFFNCPKCQSRSDIFGHHGGREMSEQMGIPFLGEIPLDGQIRDAGDIGVPITVGQPDSATARTFQDIVGKLASSISIVNAERIEQEKFRQVERKEQEKLNTGLQMLE